MSTEAPASQPDPALRGVQGNPHGASTRLMAHQLAIGFETGGFGSPGQARPIASALDVGLRGGELVCLLGPNGAGKSTLLRTLAGLQSPLAGDVRFDGVPLADWTPRQLARRLAVVLTDRAVPGLMTGAELASLGRHPHTGWTGRLGAADLDAVDRALGAVDGRQLAPRRLAEMSDGERQKMMVARALAQEAEVLILDEVTAFLDLPRRVETMGLLRQLAHDRGCAVVLATHDLDLALRSADRLWLLAGGELIQGIPESLVLDGSFGRVFAAEGVTFDRASGTFEMPRRRRGTVGVEAAPGCDGAAVRWTRRALDRVGWEAPAERSDPPSVVDPVVHVEPGPTWRLCRPRAEPVLCSQLDDLLAALATVESEARRGSVGEAADRRPTAGGR
jgi:iron complex transport system ATP-binding protein